jgi:nickel/cobalt transporter (NiCoT) family protein
MLAFALGNRHGLDADHLAAIDGLTRWNSGAGRPLPSLCGVLFSAGHATFIFAMSVALAVMSSHFAPPDWLETVGVLISGGTLIMLGLLNLRTALFAEHGAAPAGFWSRFMGPLLRASGPWRVALVGGLFALSFDSVAIAALFASSRTALGDVLLTGSCFAAGMLVVGAANGWWVVRLIRHSHRAGRQAARVMTLTIAIATLVVSVRVLTPLAIPASGAWLAGVEWLASIGVVTVVLMGYFVSGRIAGHSSADKFTHGAKSCAG